MDDIQFASLKLRALTDPDPSIRRVLRNRVRSEERRREHEEEVRIAEMELLNAKYLRLKHRCPPTTEI